MNAESTARRRAEVIDEISKWTVGAGILTVALFPLAIPIVCPDRRRSPAAAGAPGRDRPAGRRDRRAGDARAPATGPARVRTGGRGRGARRRSSSHRSTAEWSKSSPGVRSSTSNPAPRSRSARSLP